MHTWSDVAYSFVNGSGVKGDASPLELMSVFVFISAVFYICVRLR